MAVLPAAVSALLSACGGGGDAASGDYMASSDNMASSNKLTPPPSNVSLAARIVAAHRTANGQEACATSRIGPFYWEIGDGRNMLAGGSVGSDAPNADTAMSIASASKWVYSTYVLQKRGPRRDDVPYLNFTSGYTQMLLPTCRTNETVGQCVEGRDEQVSHTVGMYRYGSGHMQVHAANVMGLGRMGVSALSQEVASTLGDFGFWYSQPQLAGGLVGTANGYAAFLRKMLSGDLSMRAMLGQAAVCTNPNTCSTALGSPIPNQESWSYSLGHWVESDPAVGDGAFSSPGAFGFYPWIDASKTYYGVLARRAENETNAGYHSAECGRLIRRAWMTGVPVL